VNSPFMIGLFVITGTLLLAAAALWLGASRLFHEYNFYTTYFNASVQGLETGQPVKYQGVPIGNIQSVRVAPDGKLVEVIFRLDKTVQVSDSMRIRIEMASIAGSKYLLLFFPDTPQLLYSYPDISALSPPFPVIRSAPSAIEEMRVSLNEAINTILAIDSRGISVQSVRALKAIAEMMENPELFQTVHNLNRTSSTLSKLVNALDTTRIVGNVDRMADNVELTSRNMIAMSESMLATARRLESIATKLDQEIAQLNIARRADMVVSRYDSTMQTLTTTITAVGRSSERSLSDIRALVQELKSTSRDVRRAVRSLGDNPGQMLLAEPPPKEK
jgi:phospholipid/cholesterol/gamma-HCH transport system substrate-binding protein